MIVKDQPKFIDYVTLFEMRDGTTRPFVVSAPENNKRHALQLGRRCCASEGIDASHVVSEFVEVLA